MIQGSIIREDKADTVYLLAKKLAYDVVTGQTDNLAAALAKTSGKDIVQFAKAVEISHPGIDKKVCVTKQHGSTPSTFGTYSDSTPVGSRSTEAKTAICGGEGSTSSGGGTAAETLKNFVRVTLKEDGSKNWPTSTKSTGAESDTKNDNAKAVAKDLVEKLSSEEKTIVAGLLAKTIEGGEVIEMCLSPST